MKASVTSAIYKHPDDLWRYISSTYQRVDLTYKSAAGVLFVECDEQTYLKMLRDPRIKARAVSPISLTQPHQEISVAAPNMWTNTIAKRVGADIAWEAGFRGEGVKVAILDSGVSQHNTLRGKIAYEEHLVTDSPRDVFGHGTAVASIVAGEDPSTGFIGIAPKSSIYNIKMMDDSGRSDEEKAVRAIDRAVELGVDVINISWGLADTGDPNEPIRVAVRNAANQKIIVVAAAGNEGPAPSTITSPATDPAAVAVGSCTASETVSHFSSRGPTKEGLTKPEGLGFGENIMAADASNPSGLVKVTGTSFSTPIGSAIAALGKQIFKPYIDRDWVEKGLQGASTKPPEAPAAQHVKDNIYGYGIPDFRIYGAVAQIPAAPAALNLNQILNLLLLSMLMRAVI